MQAMRRERPAVVAVAADELGGQVLGLRGAAAVAGAPAAARRATRTRGELPAPGVGEVDAGRPSRATAPRAARRGGRGRAARAGRSSRRLRRLARRAGADGAGDRGAGRPRSVRGRRPVPAVAADGARRAPAAPYAARRAGSAEQPPQRLGEAASGRAAGRSTPVRPWTTVSMRPPTALADDRHAAGHRLERRRCRTARTRARTPRRRPSAAAPARRRGRRGRRKRPGRRRRVGRASSRSRAAPRGRRRARPACGPPATTSSHAGERAPAPR